MPVPHLQAVLFDVFGTVVDWRAGIIRQLSGFGADRGLDADWAAITDGWRGEYQPAMEEVRSGRRAWTPLDTLHRESLERVLTRHGVTGVTPSEMDALTLAWHSLDPWPDVVPGLTLLRTRFTIGTLSNGNTTLLTDMAAHAGLPWDVILGAETALAYKPRPEAYLRNVAALGLKVDDVMLVAAHNSDLTAAKSLGLRTGFVPRPTEHGPAQTNDRSPTDDWDLTAPDVLALAWILTPATH